ncbi:Hypp309 [Branchiostoma lanceolatum]|uniref:Hypp309 protein n=1 Tax=Branchiostoma lanceolatum TaxID=7740 RepID=A0A8J9YKB8_BRALA|nr:Hypp309 [Branchiostoma lanceolatum]
MKFYTFNGAALVLMERSIREGTDPDDAEICEVDPTFPTKTKHAIEDPTYLATNSGFAGGPGRHLGPPSQSWVPSGDLPVDFSLTFSAPEVVYDVCNRNFTQSGRTISVATTGVGVTPGETANDPTAMTITGASQAILTPPGDMFTILMVDPDTPSAEVGTTEKPLLHMLITNITNADPSTGAVLNAYGGPMPPPSRVTTPTTTSS